MATDRYPPFTLAYAEYPADFTVSYPERLSRGLVLVKWWLLIVPHLLIVGIFTGGVGAAWTMTSDENMLWGTTVGAPSLRGLLVLFVAVILLFTARYRLGMFALIMGINRWVFRVQAYELLLRDDYPPFRLDQGPVELSAEHPKHARRSEAEPREDPGS